MAPRRKSLKVVISRQEAGEGCLMRIPPCGQSHCREEIKRPYTTQVLSTTCRLSVSSELSVTLWGMGGLSMHILQVRGQAQRR